MNIFRILGQLLQATEPRAPLTNVASLIADLSHLLSIFILLHKMKTSSVCRPRHCFEFPDLCDENWERVIPLTERFLYSHARAYPSSHKLSISSSMPRDISVFPHPTFTAATVPSNAARCRPLLEFRRISMEHHVQDCFHCFLRLHPLPHAERLQTHPRPKP